IPAELALTIPLFIPSAKPAHIRAAIPHLIEEWTLSEINSLHLSSGKRNEDGHIAVTAIDRRFIAQALADVDSLPYACDEIYVYSALLPYPHNTLTLLIDSKRVLFRWNAMQSGAIEIHALLPFLTVLCKQQSFETLEIFSTGDMVVDHID